MSSHNFQSLDWQQEREYKNGKRELTLGKYLDNPM